MKTRHLLPAFLLIFVFSANAQIMNIEAFEDHPGNPLQEYVKTYRPGLPAEYSGTFYMEEEFIPGVVEVEGEDKRLNVFLRYNALHDEVELKLKKDEEKVYVLPRMENIFYSTPDYDYVLKSFRTDEGKTVEGYVIKYFDGEEAKFYAKPLAHMQQEVTPRSGYDRYKPAHMSVKTFYYLSVGDQPFEEVRLKERQIKKVLPGTSDLKRYFSDHKVRTAEDVVDLLKFYEEQGSPNS